MATDRFLSVPSAISSVSPSKRAATGANMRMQSPDSPQEMRRSARRRRSGSGMPWIATSPPLSSTRAPSAAAAVRAARQSAERLGERIRDSPSARAAQARARCMELFEAGTRILPETLR